MRNSPVSRPRPRPETDRHGNLIPTRISVRNRLKEANPNASEDGLNNAARTVHRRLREQAGRKSSDQANS